MKAYAFWTHARTELFSTNTRPYNNEVLVENMSNIPRRCHRLLPNVKDHITHVDGILTTSADTRVTFQMNKCHFNGKWRI